jgi:hypothetical protein
LEFHLIVSIESGFLIFHCKALYSYISWSPADVPSVLSLLLLRVIANLPSTRKRPKMAAAVPVPVRRASLRFVERKVDGLLLPNTIGNEVYLNEEKGVYQEFDNTTS